MKKVIITLSLLISCGKVKVQLPNTKHQVEHRIILEGNLDFFEETCAKRYPGDEDERLACIDGYMNSLDLLLARNKRSK